MSSPLVNPPAPVEEPSFEPAGYGLYSVATVREGDNRSQSGVEWEPTSCGVAGAIALPCPVTTQLEIVEGLPLVSARPFLVHAGHGCKLVGTTLEHLQDLARTRLRLTESTAVERTYWTGDKFGAEASPHLAAGYANVDVLAAEPVKPAYAIGLLEEAIAGMTGAVGVIHAPLVSIGAIGGFVTDASGVLRTKRGTKVSLGAGYLRTAPDGTPAPDGVVWWYATGPVLITRSPVIDLPRNLPDALDRETNDARVQAARIVSVGHACGLAAVPVTLTA